tara:strand:- start:5246 stop:6658 length:1413 start_codon:yes stop_codon:yes gene_type:complete
MRGEMSREGNAAISKYGYTNVWTEYEENYDKKWLQDRNAELSGDFIPDLLTKTGMSQINNVGGNNMSDISAYVGKQDALLAETVKKFNTDLGGTSYTAEDIVSGAVTLEELEKLGIDPIILEGAKNRVETIHRNQTIQARLLEQAKKETGYTEGVDYIQNKSYGKDSTGGYLLGGDVIDIIKETLGMEGVSDDQALQSALTALNSTTFSGSEENAAKYDMLKKLEDAGLNMATLNMVSNDMKPRTADLDKWLEKNARITVGGMASAVIPGYDAKSAQKHTKTVNKAFVGKPLDKNFEIFYNGQKQDATGTVQGLIDANGWKGTDVMVEGIKFHTAPILGEPTLEMSVKGVGPNGEDAYTTVILPYSNFKNSGLDEYFNNPSYRLASEVNASRNAGLDSTEIKFSGGLVLTFDGLKGDESIITYVDPVTGQSKKITKDSVMEDADGQTVNTLEYMIQDATAKGQTFTTNRQ